MSDNFCYFDNNATTAIAPEVFEEMKPFLTELYGNPSSMHSFGGSIRKYVDKAREQIADLINCDPEEIIFTSCGTESNNMALRGFLDRNENYRHIITSKVEHPAIRETCKVMQLKGYRLTELDVDNDGNLKINQLAEALKDGPALVSIMHANNETGVIFPIEEISKMVSMAGGTMHTDAVQTTGKIAYDLKELPIDMLSISGHKLHAPKGVGILFVRKGVKLTPYLTGGHQEHGKRGGTENVASIVALGKACELAKSYIEEENTRVKALRDKLEQGILDSCPDCVANGRNANRLPNTSNIGFSYIEGESILMNLDVAGISASSGSACSSESLEPSHVLQAMGVPFVSMHGSIRFSLCRYNTEEQVDYAIKTIPPIIKNLRAMSPFSKDGKF